MTGSAALGGLDLSYAGALRVERGVRGVVSEGREDLLGEVADLDVALDAFRRIENAPLPVLSPQVRLTGLERIGPWPSGQGGAQSGGA